MIRRLQHRIRGELDLLTDRKTDMLVVSERLNEVVSSVLYPDP